MNDTSAIGWYLIEHQIDLAILSGFPKRLSALPPHVITRLANCGMVRKHSRIRTGNCYRWQWVAGPRLPGLVAWLDKRHKI